MKKLTFIFLILLPLFSQAQPFQCKGDFFLALTESGPSIMYRVEPAADGSTVLFNPIAAGNSGLAINSIGYRSTDNYIYGVDANSENLVRVDASGTATAISPLTGLDPDLGYFAGDVSPDGQFLYLLASGGSPFITRELARVNLDDFSIERFPITNATTANVYCADFVFDPVNGDIFSFDAHSNRMIEFDFTTATVELNNYPVSTVVDAMGAMFIDAFGNLYGYGLQFDTDVPDTYYKIDKNTGVISIEAIGPGAVGKDACACPYTVKLQKTVRPKVALPCDTITYVFKIANGSASTQSGLDFLDEMPSDLEIVAILNNPFGGTIVSGIGTNLLAIEGIEIPPGIDSIVIQVSVGNNAEGVYKNQARIESLPVFLGEETFSDDPSTLVLDDSTALEVIPFEVAFENSEIGICPGDTLVLSPGIFAGVDYSWNDGSTNNSLETTEAGWYSVTVSNNCITNIDSIFVFETEAVLDLGPDLEVELGDSVLLDPIYNSAITVDWTDPFGNSLSCSDCLSPYARPFFDAVYELTIVNEFGCETTDRINVIVLKNRAIYIPTAFSPNFDGVNDVFYLQGNRDTFVRSLKIFDRWGAVVFEVDNVPLNDPTHGWDGAVDGEFYNSGVFVYFVEVEYLDGESGLFEGGFSILK